MARGRFAIVWFAAALAAPAAIASPGPPPPTGLSIEPLVTCREGERSEFIRLSKSRGDAIDGVFAFCRNMSEGSEAWIARLERIRDKLIRGSADDAAGNAIRGAFDDHIARERAAD
jgi:hypothetical protein